MDELKLEYDMRQFPIASRLPVGEENARTTEALQMQHGCGTARELQEKIQKERERGALICSAARGGYYIPKNTEEIKRFVRTLDKRALNTLKITRAFRDRLDEIEGQLSIDGVV